MELDQNNLKDMGIKKIGDRVRIGSQAKVFRNKEYKKASKRVTNRESLALLDNPILTPPSSASPRPLQANRAGLNSRSEKRMSRQITGSELNYASALPLAKAPSRPSSPLVEQEARPQRVQPRYGGLSPKDPNRKEQASYFNNPMSASTATGRAPGTPAETPMTARFAQGRLVNTAETPQTARFASHVRASPSMDSSVTNSSVLPADKALIRVIFDNGRSSVVSIEGCRTAEDIIYKTLKKGSLNEAHVKNYCFYVLDGTEPNPAMCRRLSDSELVRVCMDRMRLERNKLILRMIHRGEPQDDQLRAAANIASQQLQQNMILPSNNRSQMKIEKITGESLAAVSYPLSPTSARERERHINSTAESLERAPSSSSTASRARKMKEFYGARPPSELITSDLTSYFPDVEKEEMEKTLRMSVRRSQRLSRAASRLSMASNFSYTSLKDAPPLPTIADTWLNGGQQKSLRPLSVMRLGLPQHNSYRDSIASTVLEPLEEESPIEPNRKSYVSFSGNDSESESNTLSITDPDGNTTMGSYFDDAASSLSNTENGNSWNKRLSHAIVDDGEEDDEELVEYLEQDSWENVKYMKGAMIGQGSFGSVYLALHSVTGELMAVKQVEMPAGTRSQIDAKKNNMLEALKHEIGLLRDLKHPNIVQYLGSNSDETHLNIFLEYVAGGSVATMLVNYGPLGEGLISNFVRQILTGLAYLHSKDIIHRDIKGANILVDNKGMVKISDFGISKRVEASTLLTSGPGKKGGPRVSLQGSVFWMAPEVVKQTAYTRKADIWSLGCLIVEMFTGSHPHPNCTQLQAIFKIGGSADASPTIPDNASDDAKAFLKRTFENDHEKRPTADELLLSPFCNPKA
ncbi:mitogen-activated protein kinase [Patellaria atrata CBS 101060]|uniref:Mitogen-activated protein kinase n=1 Tax=Patellaria atrata CBS 101060 TaxID=1346257 RepID=A0A9P4SBP2_9PEZI|nr:mitogen-activated protein kinase [Patellaria atrata CBS 101060]